MNPEHTPDPRGSTIVPAEQKPGGPVVDEIARVKLFLGIQAFFLVVSVFTGGFQFKL